MIYPFPKVEFDYVKQLDKAEQYSIYLIMLQAQDKLKLFIDADKPSYVCVALSCVEIFEGEHPHTHYQIVAKMQKAIMESMRSFPNCGHVNTYESWLKTTNGVVHHKLFVHDVQVSRLVWMQDMTSTLKVIYESK